MSEKQVPTWANAAAASLLQYVRVKEPGTFEHNLRIGEMAKQLAIKLGLGEYQQRVAEIAGYLHDIGEATIDQDILAKPTKLNPIEYEIMKSHVAASEDAIRPLALVDGFFKDVLEVVHSHHEHYNGNGYPNRLKGDDIPIVSRIICVVDAFDSMTTNKVYRAALTVGQAYAELERGAGQQFDRHVVLNFTMAHSGFAKPTMIDLENYLYKSAA